MCPNLGRLTLSSVVQAQQSNLQTQGHKPDVSFTTAPLEPGQGPPTIAHNGPYPQANNLDSLMTDSTPSPNDSQATQEPVADPRKDSLIEYPSQFPIKVMGEKNDHFVHEITKIAEKFDPGFDASGIELRPSSGGKYLGVTITVTATSREQLDDIYRALTSHPMVKVVL